MKKLSGAIMLSLLLIAISSFKTPPASSYGSWKTTSCYKGLDFCVRKAEYNDVARKYEWWVKFRNRYQETVSFNCGATASSVQANRGTDRFTIRSGNESSIWFLIADENSINVFVEKLRFGKDDNGDYVPCGN